MLPNQIHFKTLNELIEKLLKKYTPEQACIVLGKVIDSPPDQVKTDAVVCEYIVQAAIATFGLNIKRLKRRESKEYIRESWSIFFLIKMHTKYSYQDIADYWKLDGIKPVRYGIEQIKNMVENPKIDKEHFEKHTILQQKVNQFIVSND